MTKRTSKRRTSKRNPLVWVRTHLLQAWDEIHLAAGKMKATDARKMDKAANLIIRAYHSLPSKKRTSRRRS